VFLLLVGIVAIGYQNPEHDRTVANQTVVTNGLATVNQAAKDTKQAPSVDEIVATDVAASLTERANLPLASNVANTALSLAAKSELAQTDDTTISKPQIVQSSTGRSMQTYVGVVGDTIPALAAKYGVSADTIRWANNLTTDNVNPGQKLTILPVSGVLYTVKSGDTVQTISEKYQANSQRVISYNDLDLSGAKEGQQLILPGGVLPENERPGYVAPVAAVAAPSQGYSDRGGYVINSNVGVSAGNRYAYGNCTWYAYNRRAQLGRPVGSFWGNANTWGVNARAAGYQVDYTPSAGAVLVDGAGYYGHVAVVESVQPNGDIVVSEMNNYAYGGFGIVNNRTISAGQASSYQYIH